MSRPEIDPFLARELRRSGMSWPRVAEELSRRAERRPGFRVQSVQRAVHDAFGTTMVKAKRWVP